jgi:hypothetical protein
LFWATTNTTIYYGSFIQFYDNDTFAISDYRGSYSAQLVTLQVFRDPSAYYHIVVAVDTTQATASNRMKLYVNGTQVTTFGTATYPSQNFDFYFDAAGSHNIGRDFSNAGGGGARNYFDGYITEVNFIDGQALTPSSFGETDAITGVWKPKKYTGTFGTNGFYLNFSDNSNNTAATIGKDYSVNGNNWTPNNISVTSGVTYDSMLDVPTMWADGGNGRGNYCVLNPLDWLTYATNISQGNLRYFSPAQSYGNNTSYGTVSAASGKYYFEVALDSIVAGYSFYVGISDVAHAGRLATLSGSVSSGDSLTLLNGTTQQSSIGQFSVNDIVGVAYDLNAGTVQFYRNGSTFGNVVATLTSDTYVPLVSGTTSSGGSRWALDANFGQRPFAYTPPTGFKALNTQNLPDATIKKGNNYFDATAYSGNSSTQNIVNSGAMQPDLVWMKNRSGALAHYLNDSVRGAYKTLFSNLTNAEYDGTSFSDGVSTFNSNGFTLLNGTNVSNYNASGSTYVAWQWKESAAAGFDIVTYAGDGYAARNISHSLGVAPAMMIIKCRDISYSWAVYHKSVGNTAGLYLEQLSAANTSSVWWNNTSPTSSQFTVSTGANVNANGYNFVAYLFAEVSGYSKFGSYTGNLNADGPFINLGFRPRFIMIKGSNVGSVWAIFDTARDSYNAVSNELLANYNYAENQYNVGVDIDVTSCGFKIKSSSFNNQNAAYIYAAFAENPFKNALAR